MTNNLLPPIISHNLLQQALTHRSYINEHSETEKDNERLEFLGDAILGFVVGELLYQRYPEMSEAQLTRLRSNLVDEKQLTQFAKKLGLGRLMRLGKGAEKDRGRENPALLSDCFEAIIAAYFLESGIQAVREYVEPLFMSVAEEIIYPQSDVKSNNLVDPKNRFQQWALATQGENPEYVIIRASGPDHAKEFTAQVMVKGKVYGKGKGRRKQEAEKSAAENALKNLGVD